MSVDPGPELPLGDPLPQTSAPPVPVLPVATMGQRAGAALLEMILFGACLGIGWVIWWIALWDHGLTPAKSVLKLRVVRPVDGSVPSTLHMAAHELLTKAMLPLVLVTSAVALTDPEHRSLWDHVTKLSVISDRPAEASTEPT